MPIRRKEAIRALPVVKSARCIEIETEIAEHNFRLTLAERYYRWHNRAEIARFIRIFQDYLRDYPNGSDEWKQGVARRIKLYRRRHMELTRGTFDNGRPAIRAGFTREWPSGRRY